jgi:hypothetical protein
MPPKKANKKKKASTERSLILHTTPQLAELLEQAKRGEVNALQEYLSKGDSHSAMVELNAGKRMPLLLH